MRTRRRSSENEKFAMRKHILAMLAAGAAAIAVAETLPAEAGPLRGGWSADKGRPQIGGSPARRPKFKGGPFIIADNSFGGGRYLSESAWFLSDIGGYLADEPAYPDELGGYGYGHSMYSGPAGYGYRRSASYSVPVYRSRHGSRRVVTVHRGAPNPVIARAAFSPGRRLAR
jgi:hypothetical protein